MERNRAEEATAIAQEEQAGNAKRPYSAPAIEDETEFESLAMGCGQTVQKCGSDARTA